MANGIAIKTDLIGAVTGDVIQGATLAASLWLAFMEEEELKLAKPQITGNIRV